MRYIALDMGSSYTKCAVLCESGTLSTWALPAPPNRAGTPQRYEVDGEKYFEQAEAVLGEAAKDGADGLLISTQMHGYMLTDERFRPISPYVSWQDRLSAQHLESFRDALGPDACAPSGVPLKGNLALCGLMARMLDGEEIPKGALFCTLGGYLIGRLVGEHVCHMTNAAPTGLADVKGGGWNSALRAKAGLDSLLFPRIERGLSPVGSWRGIPVYPDLGDQQVCAFGAALPAETGLHISLGTAGLIGAKTSVWGTGPYENRPWIEPGSFLRTVSGLPGGRHAAMLHGFFMQTALALTGSPPAEEAVWNWMSDIAEAPPSAGDTWAMLQGGPEFLAAAVYAEIGQAYRAATDGMGLRISSIAFSGGVAEKNPAIRGAVARALLTSSDATIFDVMVGMRALAEMVSKHAGWKE